MTILDGFNVAYIKSCYLTVSAIIPMMLLSDEVSRPCAVHSKFSSNITIVDFVNCSNLPVLKLEFIRWGTFSNDQAIINYRFI